MATVGFSIARFATGDEQGFVGDTAGADQFQIGAQLPVAFAHDRIRRLANDVVQVDAG